MASLLRGVSEAVRNAVPAALALLLGSRAAAQTDYAADVRFAVDEIEKQCGELIRLKGIDWKAVTAPFLEQAGGTRTHQEHLVQLCRLLARLHDGHAEVQPLEAGDVRWPEDPRGEKTGPGMFWCRIGKKLYIKNTWNDAERVGLAPGMELISVGGQPANVWLDARIAEICDQHSFSTTQQAFFYACHWGLEDHPGTKLELVVKKPSGKKSERTLIYGRANPVPWGPAFFPENLEAVKEDGDISYGFTEKDWGYVHMRRAPSDLPEQMDVVLETLHSAPGLILDFRANGGGGFDHDALFGRFVPAGKTFETGKSYASAGPHPYGGPIVAIIDANVRSAGETAAGMFKDDGRAYVIGESATAGMSSQKTTIELPSRLFALYVSVGSNKGRYNEGRGIEGLGIIPHRIVEYDPQDLEEHVDTLIRTAEALLAKFPQKEVRYDPKEFGWKK